MTPFRVADVAAPGFDVAARHRPAHDDPVGGDWHDVVAMPDGATAFVVGDAAGHGVEVAGVMARLRDALRAHLAAGIAPHEALDRLDALVPRLLPGQMATAVVCVVDLAAGRLRVASAGHLPPFGVGVEGVAALDVPVSPALGLVPAGRDAGRSVLEASLGPEDAMVLFSDGLVERRGTPVPEVLEELASALRGPAATGAAAELCERALSVGSPSGEDDVTVLAWRRAGTGRV